jgi:hypothetical protein
MMSALLAVGFVPAFTQMEQARVHDANERAHDTIGFARFVMFVVVPPNTAKTLQHGIT